MDEMAMNYLPFFDRKGERKWISGVGFAVFALTVISLLGQFIVAVLAGLFFPQMLVNPWGLYFLALVPLWFLAVPAYWGILRMRRKVPVVKRTMSFGEFCLCFLMCVPVMYVGNLLGNVISSLLNDVAGTDTVNQVSELMDATGLLPTTVFAVILAPVIEELTFRKLLCDRMRRYGDKAAILVSAVVFGLYHGNLYQFFYAAVLGALFAFVYCRTGRVIYTILLHMLVNFLGSVVPMAIMSICEEALSMTGGGDLASMAQLLQDLRPGELLGQLALLGGYGLLILGGSLAGAAAIFACRKKFVCLPGEVVLPKGQGCKTVVWNTGSVFALIALVAVLMVNTFLS